MIRFAADENFDNNILRGLQRRQPNLDLVRIQDTEIFQSADPVVLEWVAKEGRILLTHDTRTMPDHAYERVKQEKPMPGVFIINDQLPIGQVIEELLIIVGASDASEWENLVVFFPLK
jgi:hypothetical protein